MLELTRSAKGRRENCLANACLPPVPPLPAKLSPRPPPCRPLLALPRRVDRAAACSAMEAWPGWKNHSRLVTAGMEAASSSRRTGPTIAALHSASHSVARTR